MATRVESNVKPRVFFQDFPNKVIYVRDLPPEGGWRDVFLADTSHGRPRRRCTSRARGASGWTASKRLVQLELIDGTSHTTHARQARRLRGAGVRELRSSRSTRTRCFKRPPAKGAPEMTYRRAARGASPRRRARNDPAYEARFMIQQKFVAAARPARSWRSSAWRSARATARTASSASFVLGIRRDLRLLRAAVGRARGGDGRPVQPRMGAVDPEHRHGRRRRRAARLARSRRPISRFASASRRSGAAPSARRPTATRRSAGRRSRASRSSIATAPLRTCRCRDCSTCTSRASTCASSLLGVVGAARRSSTSRRSSTWSTSCSAARPRGDAAAVLLLPDAAVRLLRHPDGGARRRRSSPSA